MRSSSDTASPWYGPQNSASCSLRFAGASERNVWIDTSGLLISWASPAASVPTRAEPVGPRDLLARAAQRRRRAGRCRWRWPPASRSRRAAVRSSLSKPRAAAPVVDREGAEHALLGHQGHHQELVRRHLRHPAAHGPLVARRPGLGARSWISPASRRERKRGASAESISRPREGVRHGPPPAARAPAEARGAARRRAASSPRRSRARSTTESSSRSSSGPRSSSCVDGARDPVQQSSARAAAGRARGRARRPRSRAAASRRSSSGVPRLRDVAVDRSRR